MDNYEDVCRALASGTLKEVDLEKMRQKGRELLKAKPLTVQPPIDFIEKKPKGRRGSKSAE